MIKARTWLAAGLMMAAPLGASASAAPSAPPADQEVRIPFVQFGGVRSFRAVSDQVVYLEGRRSREWYRATMNGPCFNLAYALSIGIDTRFNGNTLDNSSRLLVDGDSCPILSLVRSDPPPRRRR
jgi:hypothetical protein